MAWIVDNTEELEKGRDIGGLAVLASLPGARGERAIRALQRVRTVEADQRILEQTKRILKEGKIGASEEELIIRFLHYFNESHATGADIGAVFLEALQTPRLEKKPDWRREVLEGVDRCRTDIEKGLTAHAASLVGNGDSSPPLDLLEIVGKLPSAEAHELLVSVFFRADKPMKTCICELFARLGDRRSVGPLAEELYRQNTAYFERYDGEEDEDHVEPDYLTPAGTKSAMRMLERRNEERNIVDAIASIGTREAHGVVLEFLLQNPELWLHVVSSRPCCELFGFWKRSLLIRRMRWSCSPKQRFKMLMQALAVMVIVAVLFSGRRTGSPIMTVVCWSPAYLTSALSWVLDNWGSKKTNTLIRAIAGAYIGAMAGLALPVGIALLFIPCTWVMAFYGTSVLSVISILVAVTAKKVERPFWDNVLRGGTVAVVLAVVFVTIASVASLSA